jgi:Notch-like protein
MLSEISRRVDNDSKDNVDTCNYLITNFNKTFSRINLKYATTYEINKILISLNTKNSYRYDEIPIKILKLSVPFIISPLTYICNKSLSSVVFPERLKFAIIKSVYKKGNKLLTINYRPISLLTSFSKIFDKLIYSRLYIHICNQ